MSRYSRVPALIGVSAPPGMVRVRGGLLPRDAVRLVLAPRRPPQVPPAAHGGISLSRRDAQWLFEWAAPGVAKNMPAAIAASDDPAALFVLID